MPNEKANATNAVVERINAAFGRHGNVWPEEALELLEAARDEIKRLKSNLAIADDDKDEALTALEAFREYDGDAGLWATMKRQRDEAIAERDALQNQHTQLMRAYDPNCEEYHFDEQLLAMNSTRRITEAMQDLAEGLGRDPEGSLSGIDDEALGQIQSLKEERDALAERVGVLEGITDAEWEALSVVAEYEYTWSKDDWMPQVVESLKSVTPKISQILQALKGGDK